MRQQQCDSQDLPWPAAVGNASMYFAAFGGKAPPVIEHTGKNFLERPLYCPKPLKPTEMIRLCTSETDAVFDFGALSLLEFLSDSSSSSCDKPDAS